ncbi:MAG: anti-sigma factor family protein [Planctomycetota bacterium]|jgi:hypothetical protein
MKDENNIKELLNAYLDGELSQRQQIEVRRMIDHDPAVAQQFNQFRKVKMLVTSLPRAEAPEGMVEDIKIALQRKQVVQTEPAARIVGNRQLIFRKILSSAAMIALLAVLAVVIISILAPGPDTVTIPYVDNSAQPKPTANLTARTPATAGFYGTIEFKTADFAAVNSVINNTLKEKGLVKNLKVTDVNQGIYEISCSQDEMKQLLSDLENIWQRSDATTLLVNTGDFAKNIVIKSATPGQVATIIEQDNYSDLNRTAHEFVLLNTINKSLPSKEILSTVHDKSSLLIPKPVLTGGERTFEKPATTDDDAKVTLVIRVLKNK